MITPKSITFLHVGMARDGAERVIAHLANTYAEQGFVVYIIVMLLDICEYDLHPNVKIVSFVRPDKPRWRNLPYWIWETRKHIKQTNPEKVISFSMYINIITLLACAGLKKEILISERNDPSSDGRSILDELLTKWLYRYADKIVFQTKRAQQCFPWYIQKRSRIIGNPVFISCEAVEEKQNKIVTVGRLTPQKNQEMLLEAFSIVNKQFPDLYLEIYGKGELLEYLKVKSRALGIGSRVLFKGSVTNIHEKIRDAKAFVLSSDYEGLSNALLEAMAMGLPCISTSCAGSDEIILPGYNGLLTPIGDAKELADAICHVLSDMVLSNNISRNSKQIGHDFNHRVIIKKWLDYINE